MKETTVRFKAIFYRGELLSFLADNYTTLWKKHVVSRIRLRLAAL